MNNVEKKIVICGKNIDADVNTVFNEKSLIDDERLINSIVQYAEKIKSNGGEIFKHEKNVIATSDGYFFAFYLDDLNKV